jgi:hypothetical protein
MAQKAIDHSLPLNFITVKEPISLEHTMTNAPANQIETEHTSRKLLSDDEIKAYKRDGYVVPNYRLSPEVLAHLQQMCVNLMVDNPTVTGVPLTHMHAPGYSGQNLVQRDDWFAACTMPDILDMVEQLHGPDIVLWSSAVFHKEAFKGGRVNYHRDSLHFPIEPCISPNVWIAVTPSTIENGCVRMVKGSHQER